MFNMIGDILSLTSGYFALKRAKQDAAIQAHKTLATQQLAGDVSQTAYSVAQLYSFKGENLLREESFWMVATPIVISCIYPEFVHKCVLNVQYAIPEAMLYMMATIILTIFGANRLKNVISSKNNS